MDKGIDSGSLRRKWYFPRRATVWDVTLFLCLVAVTVWSATQGATKLGYHWQWYRVPQYVLQFEEGRIAAGPLLQGLWVTARITAASLILAFVIGLLTAVLRLSGSFLGRSLARGYLELIRNTPLLVQLFFIYFVFSPILDIGRFASAVLALSLFEGAYASEIFRAGILSIHRGQWEGAYSLGLGTFDTYRLIVLPQAIRRILPPLASQAISLVKDSALVSTIAIYDLTMRGQEIIAETYLAFELWFTIAAMYLAVTVSLSMVINALEARLRMKA